MGKFIDLTPRERPWDGWLLVAVCALLGIGVVMVYSASAITADWQYGNEFYYLYRQLIFVGIGLVLLFLGLKIDYRRWEQLAYPILGATILLLIAVVLVGTTVKGARRWIRFPGFNIQPAEIAKITMAFVLAYSMAKKTKMQKIRSFMVGIVPHIILVGMCILLLLMQPDFGSSVLLVSMMGAMLFYAGTNMAYIVGGVLLAGGGAYLLVTTSAYRMERVTAFMNPWEHQQESGYQLIESMASIVNGGIEGRGLGEGLGKLGFVPELHTDFIGDIIAEEFGFWGMLVIIGLYLLFAFRGFLISIRARDYFGRYVAFGLTFIITLQAAVNMCVISGLAPTKGFTMPFVSYGGSSLLMCLFAVGVLLNISKGEEDKFAIERERRKKEKQERQWAEKKEKILNKRRNA